MKSRFLKPAFYSYYYLCYIYTMNKMLIVDDAQSWRRYHQDCIQQLYKDKYTITTAASASEANDLLYAESEDPYDVILTDMQMESDYLPLYAGEWFIEQIQNFEAYKNSRIIIISAAMNIKFIAEKYNVEYIRKADCRSIESYRIVGG